MTVRNFHPEQHPIRVTQEALDYLQRQIKQAGAAAMQLGILSTGCNGHQYDMALLQQIEVTEDIQSYQIAEGLLILIPKKDLPALRGTEIDFVEEGLNHRLIFRNPNALIHCGCGESFSLKASSDG